jgi:hypothetical protein
MLKLLSKVLLSLPATVNASARIDTFVEKFELLLITVKERYQPCLDKRKTKNRAVIGKPSLQGALLTG